VLVLTTANQVLDSTGINNQVNSFCNTFATRVT